MPSDLPTVLSSSLRPKEPIILPRFIFLCGIDDEEERLATANAIIDNTLHTYSDSFQAILEEGMASLLYGGTLPLEENRKTPFGMDFPMFCDWFRRQLDISFGGEAMGHIALQQATLQDDMWDNMLFIDTKYDKWIVPFVRYYGADEVLVLVKNYSKFSLNHSLHAADEKNDQLLLLSGWKSTDELLTILRSLPRRSKWNREALGGAA